MMFSSPWAWIGALAVAAPIAIHLLTRQQARPLPFPTLRFLKGATITFARQRRLRDVALLVLRCATLLAVVAAGAGPILRAIHGPAPAATVLRRAIVIDTSASMSRKTADGRTAIDSARTQAAALMPSADQTRTIEFDRLDAAIATAAAWLDHAPGRRELVVFSDFQRGALESGTLAMVPKDDGVRLIRIDVPTPAPASASAGLGSRTFSTRAIVEGDTTRVSWRNAFAVPPLAVQVLAGATPSRDVEAAIDAAESQGLPTGTAAHAVAVVSADADGAAQLLANARPIDRPWMFDAVQHVRRDETLTAAAMRSTATLTAPALLDVIARDRQKHIGVAAGAAGAGDAQTLQFFVLTKEPLLLSATIAAAARSAVGSPGWEESEPATLTDAQLAAWNRPTPPEAPVSAQEDGRSDARWFWALALLLVIVETVARRSRPSQIPVEAAHEHVA